MKRTKKTTFFLIVAASLLGLVSWSPTPAGDDIVVGSTSMTSPSGPIVVVGSGSSGIAKYTLALGVNHLFSNDRANTIVGGSANTVDASTSLVAGFSNTLSSATSTEVRNSCAIGGSNNISSPHGYAIGYQNQIPGDYGAALGYGNTVGGNYSSTLGTGLNVQQNTAVAVGRYNETMTSGDVFAVGTGSSSVPKTALRATSDGSVILGSTSSGVVTLAKAQGDISMGGYSN